MVTEKLKQKSESEKKTARVRNAKSKGSSFEYDCQESLQIKYPETIRTSERGFQLQYDLENDSYVYECKRLKGFSWNQLIKYYYKLASKTPKSKVPVLLFQANRQPCLAMVQAADGKIMVSTFEEILGIPFIKHKSTRNRGAK